MADKLKIMSVSIEPEKIQLLDEAVAKLGLESRSEIVRKLVDEYLDLLTNDSDTVNVILRIPSELKTNKEGLDQWLAQKTTALSEKIADGSSTS